MFHGEGEFKYHDGRIYTGILIQEIQVNGKKDFNMVKVKKFIKINQHMMENLRME